MNSVYNTVDYINNSFVYPSLNRIHGYPTYVSLLKLKKQLKTNAKSVSTDLGGGSHGHLGLVLSPEEYATVSRTPYEFPAHPGDFTLPRNTPSDEAMIYREQYYEQLRLYREAVEVRKALIKQIVAAVEDQFLDELRDEASNDIEESIPDILKYLFDNFGDVGSADVQREEAKLKAFHWNVVDPPMGFFTMIEDFQVLATAAGLPRTDEMLINYGLEIIQKTGDFEIGLMAWYTADDVDKTWTNFKQHFSKVHRDLKKARGDTMRQTSFQAYNITQEITDSISDLRNELRSSIAAFGNAPHSHHQHSTTASMSSLSPSANSATNTDLLQLVLQLQNQLLLSKQPSTAPANPPKRTFVRNITDKYCWSHGACGHDGTQCRNKKPGHRDDATFANKLGGSTFLCNNKADNKNI